MITRCLAVVLIVLGGAWEVFGQTVHAPTSVHVAAALVDAAAFAVNPGDTIQTVIAAHPAGSSYLIKSGTHRNQTITPRNGDTFTGETGAILSGAKLLASPSGSGPWTYSGQTQHNTEQGTCRNNDAILPDQPQCQHPEDLWINGVQQHHVATVGEVTVGTANWFFNYATDVITIGTNPAGKIVETSTTDLAFVSEGAVVTGVTIQNVTVEKYATPGGKAAVSAPNGQSWIVRNSVIRDNHATGVGLGTGGQILSNYIHHNGQSGIGAYDAGTLIVRGNEVSYNGPLFDPFWGAGGIKLAFVNVTTIDDNNVHHNFGPAIWCDIDCKTLIIKGNTVTSNDQAGIVYEISFDGLIYDNIVRSNGFNAGSGPAQAGIFIAASQNVAVYNNTVEDNAWGIYAYQEVRGTSIAYAPLEWEIEGLNVHDNIVKTAGRVGLEQAESDTTYFTSRNNHFEANTYTLSGSTAHFTWADANGRTFAAWQGYGNDLPTGSATTY